MARPSYLPKSANTLVLAVLQKEHEPLSAYQILDKLRKQGVKSPPIIYRALEKLVHNGDVHRIEHLNAYMACNHDHHHDLSIITICNSCKNTQELDNDDIIHHLEKLNHLGIKLVRGAVLEFPVTCQPCQRHASPA